MSKQARFSTLRNLRPLTLLLVPFLAACAGSGSGASKIPVLVKRDLSPKEEQTLKTLDSLFRSRDKGYAAARERALRDLPAVGPWLALVLTRIAVLGHDDLLRKNGRPPRLDEGHESPHLFFRARAELRRLGKVGGQAIRNYLLRDKRSAVRKTGVHLLRAFASEARLYEISQELEEGNDQSRREVLRMLAEFLGHEGARKLLVKACRSSDWRLRGTAMLPFAKWQRESLRVDLGFFWRVAKSDADSFVRQQALLAIAELGDATQVRRLLAQLEFLVTNERGREAEFAAKALYRLTGKRFGPNVGAWRRWLATVPKAGKGDGK